VPALARTTTHVAGVLRCAAFASAHRTLLPRAIAALATSHPDLRVTTRDLEPEHSLPALKLGELDLALAQEYGFKPAPKDPALERTDLLEDTLRLALPADHPLADRREVDVAALEAEPWIAGSVGTFCHLVVIHSAHQAGYEPRIAHVTNDFQVSYALIAANAGVGLVPELAGPPPPGVVIKPVAGAPPYRRIYAAVRAGSAERPAIAAMLDALTAR
jgi:DNA-binding transcriptional LysR family regulator